MSRMKSLFSLIAVCLCFTANNTYAADKILNIYAWAGEVPDFVVRLFEQSSGIKVNISTYENNELMYARLRASPNPGYDVIMPSSYFVDRMRRQDMLEPLDKTKISNWANISTHFTNSAYDPGSKFSMPYIWGITGIFVNDKYFKTNSITKWSDLWAARFKDKLLMLDDMREIFSMALLSLGYSANDSDPEHIKQAFLKLKDLMRNVKVFSTDTVVSIMIDEDVTVGMSWTGDAYKAARENPNIKFIYPKDGFVIWVDNFAIPKSAPHKDEAYAFLNFILRPDIAKEIAMYTNFPTTNLAAFKLLPTEVQNNETIYPSKAILDKGQFQTDTSDATLALYEKYWEQLKMGG